MWPATRRLTLTNKHPPVTPAELAVQLELELLFHGQTAFAARLKRALGAAYRAGQQQRGKAYKEKTGSPPARG